MKKYIYSALLLTAALANASCDKMLDPESDLIMYEDDNQLTSQNDTLYSVMGVIHLMQQVADRTNLLGEVRADLVTLTSDASTALQELANFEAGTDNEYNRPMDYYAIINNCNYFIEHADINYVKNGTPVFERELAVMQAYRAWAYLQLCQVYGDVPFYTNFLDSEDEAAEIRKNSTLNVKEICNNLIPELEPYQNTRRVVYPHALYGYSIDEFTIPVKLMLGELCLWAERYEEAARWYHAFFTDVNYLTPLYPSFVQWALYTDGHIRVSDGYSASRYITIIPMETNPLYGNISELRNLYCSTTENYNHYEIGYSKHALEISNEQVYYMLQPNAADLTKTDTVLIAPDHADIADKSDARYIGDLRLYSMYREGAYNNDGNANYLDKFITNYKHTSEDRVVLYRNSTIYLHYAEALNRAGFPTAAFAVLKYGLCVKNTIEHPIADPVAAAERERAGELIEFDELKFTPSNTMGIHAMGCGDTYANPEYEIPALATANDTMLWVEDKLVDEMALENIFEGKRFYDLMRVALRRNDPAYLANRVAARNGKDQIDAALQSKLMDKRNWYMPLK